MPYPFPYLHFNALCMIFAISAVVPAWIAIWAGTSKQHWFWRAFAIWASAVTPIPMRGYELAGILAITLPLLAVTIALLEQFLISRDQTWSRKPTIRFPLRDIFIFTLLAALILAAVLHWWRVVVQLGISGGHHWGALLVNFALAGTAFWMLTLLSWFTVTHYRVRGALALLAAIPIFAYAIPIIGRMTLFGIRFDYLPPWQALGISFRPGPLGPSPFILTIVLSEFAIGLLVTLVITRRPTHSPLTFSRLLLAVPLIFLAISYYKMIWLTPLPPRYSDAPNNYAPIIEIMRESERQAKSPTTPPNAPQPSVLIREATRLLQADNYIPYDPVEDVAIRNRIDHYFVDHHNRLRLFAKKIDDEAAAALASGDRAKALDCALANIRLGLMLQRGATYFDYMFGSQAHLLAQKRLVGLRRDFSTDNARRVIRAIDDAIDQADDSAAVRVRSRAFAERTFGWSSRLDHVIEDFGLGGAGLDDAVYLDAWFQRRGAVFRLLQTDLALRLYHHDHGAWPQSLNQIVPDCLPDLPIDPHSGRPFIYRPGSEGFLLYSVGKDGIDNGGRFTNAAAYTRAIGGSTENPGYDFDLDALIRP